MGDDLITHAAGGFTACVEGMAKVDGTGIAYGAATPAPTPARFLNSPFGHHDIDGSTPIDSTERIMFNVAVQHCPAEGWWKVVSVAEHGDAHHSDVYGTRLTKLPITLGMLLGAITRGSREHHPGQCQFRN